MQGGIRPLADGDAPDIQPPGQEVTRESVGTLSAALAGLQGGMIGAFLMLAWLGVSSGWQGQSFWTAENLMASVFYPADLIRSGFHARTLSGLSMYLVIYSLLGAAVGAVLRERLSRVRVTLASIAIALGWYYVTFRWMWRGAAPALAFLHAEQPTILGHVIYGLWLGRYPEYIGKGGGAEPAPAEAPDPNPQAPILNP